MNLTENEKTVMAYLQDTLDEQMDTIAYSEMASDLSIDSKQLRGVLASLLKKKLITHDYQKDAGVSFIGRR